MAMPLTEGMYGGGSSEQRKRGEEGGGSSDEDMYRGLSTEVKYSGRECEGELLTEGG